ncbi:MAG: tetratricopeptide repeat protein [Candidatus Sulfotelmatobacter sp.]|jgi:tetratricopeptide (TPR) repeat protein
MKRYVWSLGAVAVFFFSLTAVQAAAQAGGLIIPAGTPEDRDLQAISAESDAAKKLTMYQDFVQKYSSNAAAVAYGNWQISQAYQTSGDLNKGLEYGDKALAAAPQNIDILVSQASLAQQAKDNAKLMNYSVRGGAACKAIGEEAKPEGMSDADFQKQAQEEKDAVKNSCTFLESAGFNVIVDENDAKKRMAYIEEYSTAFPESKFADQVSSYAMYTLGPGQLNDQSRLFSYGEKTLAANPNSLPALLLLAGSYVDDPKPGSVGKAITYAQKAIVVAKADDPAADKPRKTSGGVAHSILGYAYLKQDKTGVAVPELKTAVGLLKGTDEQQYAIALYRLGFAYAKLNKVSEAREVLTEAVKINGPVQPMSQDLLAKVNAARAKGK